MSRNRSSSDTEFFPKSCPGRQRKNRRIFLLALLLGVAMAAAFGSVLYLLNRQGRI